MKTFVMALALVTVTAAPAMAAHGADGSAVQRSASAGEILGAAPLPGAPHLQMVAEATMPRQIVNETARSYGTASAIGAETSLGHTQWRFDPTPDLYRGGD